MEKDRLKEKEGEREGVHEMPSSENIGEMAVAFHRSPYECCDLNLLQST